MSNECSLEAMMVESQLALTTREWKYSTLLEALVLVFFNHEVWVWHFAITQKLQNRQNCKINSSSHTVITVEYVLFTCF